MRLPAEILSLAGARSADFGLQMLACDPVGARLPAPARRALVAAALDDGAAVGRALAAHHPGVAPDGIARGLGIGVVETDELPWAGPLLRHAEYRGDPPEIRLFRAALEPLDRLLATPEACGLIGTACAGPVFLAHELYHHVEATREAPSLPRRHAVMRLRLGRWRLSAPVHALSEIAAGACAQALLGLRHHAAMLDLLALWRVAPALAVRRMLTLHEARVDCAGAGRRIAAGCPGARAVGERFREPIA